MTITIDLNPFLPLWLALAADCITGVAVLGLAIALRGRIA